MKPRTDSAEVISFVNDQEKIVALRLQKAVIVSVTEKLYPVAKLYFLISVKNSI